MSHRLLSTLRRRSGVGRDPLLDSPSAMWDANRSVLAQYNTGLTPSVSTNDDVRYWSDLVGTNHLTVDDETPAPLLAVAGGIKSVKSWLTNGAGLLSNNAFIANGQFTAIYVTDAYTNGHNNHFVLSSTNEDDFIAIDTNILTMLVQASGVGSVDVGPSGPGRIFSAIWRNALGEVYFQATGMPEAVLVGTTGQTVTISQIGGQSALGYFEVDRILAVALATADLSANLSGYAQFFGTTLP